MGLEIGSLDGSVFEEENSGVIGGAGETADNFTGIDGATGDFFYGAETCRSRSSGLGSF